jgi:hypothetical protein
MMFYTLKCPVVCVGNKKNKKIKNTDPKWLTSFKIWNNADKFTIQQKMQYSSESVNKMV